LLLYAFLAAAGCGAANPAPGAPPGGADAAAPGGDASTPGAGACFADDSPGGPGRPECATLPYARQSCAPDRPPGVVACEWYRPKLKAAAFAELFECLTALSGGAAACGVAADFQAFSCFQKLQAGRGDCLAPAVDVGGRSVGCAELVVACTTNTADQKDLGLSVCNAELAGFTPSARAAALRCYLDSAGTLCSDRLLRCVTPPAQ
jgi:hypothetical protein